jgi:hypothetical protein
MDGVKVEKGRFDKALAKLVAAPALPLQEITTKKGNSRKSPKRKPRR